MDCAKIIQETQDYIAQNLFEPLSAEALAGRVGFSHYYFCKLFSFYTGMPVMEYIRRARLAHAAHEICAGKRILDVAVECGFESHGGFSKAFKILERTSSISASARVLSAARSSIVKARLFLPTGTPVPR